MAYVEITKEESNGVYIDFGVYSSMIASPQVYNSNTIVTIKPSDVADGVFLLTEGRDAQTWKLSHTAIDGYMTIDKINGVAPTSQIDLIKKLTALM